jgi:hypothetical protein
MRELWEAIQQVFAILGELIAEQAGLIVTILLLLAWVVWWLWAVNWSKTWPVLAQGAWLPLVLLLVVSALVWSQIAPGSCVLFGFLTVTNFWWQLGGVGLLTALALFCGWLQGYCHWTPAEIHLHPPALDDHGHDHEFPEDPATAAGH